MKILIAEDAVELRNSIITYLTRDGHLCEIASNHLEALYKIDVYSYDLVLLDINLITGSGLRVLQQLKKDKIEVAVIIISANNSLEDTLEGLDLGADDYLTKPFHLAELNSRIKAVLRRGKFGGNHTVVCNEITVNTLAKTVYVMGELIVLTKKEYDLLLFFITNQQRVLSKEMIAEHLWGDQSDLVDNFDFIYVHINNLRKKLTTSGAKYIETVYGSGYRFVATN